MWSCGADIVNIRWTRSWRTTLRASFWSGPTRFRWFTFSPLSFPFRRMRCLARTLLRSWTKGTTLAQWPRSSSGTPRWGTTRSSRMESLTFVAVHQPRVPLWADEGWHDKKDGVNSQCHWQCILSLFQVVRKHCMLFFTWSVTLRE